VEPGAEGLGRNAFLRVEAKLKRRLASGGDLEPVERGGLRSFRSRRDGIRAAVDEVFVERVLDVRLRIRGVEEPVRVRGGLGEQERRVAFHRQEETPE